MQAKAVSWCLIQITDSRRYYTFLKEEELVIYHCASWSITTSSGENSAVSRYTVLLLNLNG